MAKRLRSNLSKIYGKKRQMFFSEEEVKKHMCEQIAKAMKKSLFNLLAFGQTTVETSKYGDEIKFTVRQDIPVPAKHINFSYRGIVENENLITEISDDEGSAQRVDGEPEENG